MIDHMFSPSDNQREYCEAVADDYKHEAPGIRWYRGSLYYLILDMMLSGFCLFFLCQIAEGQSIIVSGDGRSIVVSGRSELAPIKTEPVVVKPVVVPAQPVAQVQKVKRRYVAMFTASYCQPCQIDKRDQLPKVRRRGHYVREVEMTLPENIAAYESKVSGYPTYWICDWETGVRIGDPIVGPTSGETLIALLGDSPPVQRVIPLQPVHTSPSPGEILTPSGWQGQTLPSQTRVMPNRYIQWPGWGQIDLQTYNRNCNCPMCQRIRGLQQEYQRQLRAYQQTALPDDQKPCPMETVEAMLDAMQLTPDDTLVDLGCGDGRILIAAARRGVKGIGVELDHARAETARQAIRDAGVSSLVSVETGDARDFDTSRATAITAYLYPTLLAELAPKMKTARVAASPYHEVPGLSMVQVGDVWLYNRNEG